jgi:hypothetical protein
MPVIVNTGPRVAFFDAIMTLDSDFSIYRKHGRIPLALIQPDGLPL